MSTKIAIHGFGRLGRLALRAAWRWPELEIIYINECAGSAQSGAQVLVECSGAFKSAEAIVHLTCT